jgi:hypothetical protein
LLALLLAVGGAASFDPPPGGVHHLLAIPVQQKTTDCAKLDVTVELGSGFDEVTCSGREKGYGGESPHVERSRIDAVGPRMDLVLFHDHGGSNTYFDRQTPRSLIESNIDYDIPGSWAEAEESNDFAIATFTASFGAYKIPCFAFARYAGHVSRSTGYSNRVFGVYCDKTGGSQPLAAARIDEATGKIKAEFF